MASSPSPWRRAFAGLRLPLHRANEGAENENGGTTTEDSTTAPLQSSWGTVVPPGMGPVVGDAAADSAIGDGGDGKDDAGGRPSPWGWRRRLRRRQKQQRRRSTDSSDADPTDAEHDGRKFESDFERREARQLERDRRAVLRLRIVFVCALLASALAVSLLAFFFARSFETEMFERQYESSAARLLDSFTEGVGRKVHAASTFSAMYTSRYSHLEDEDGNRRPWPWPNATMPDFQVQAEGQLDLSGGRAISFNPLITDGTMRERWEAHATENAHVLESDLLINRQPGKRIVADGIFRVANGTRIDDPGVVGGSYPDVLVPVWQIAPIVTNEAAVMFNLKSVPNRQRALDDMMRYNITALTDLLQLVQDEETRPSSILFYPVFDSFPDDSATSTTTTASTSTTGTTGTTGGKVVGSISVVFSWDDVFDRSLPANIHGVHCVLETNYGSSFTFSINGGIPRLLGEGDRHERKFDHMERGATASLRNVEYAADDEEAADLGVADDLVVYSVRTYPSTQLERVYVSRMPAVYAASIVALFAFVSLVFVTYDHLAKRYTREVSEVARRTDRIVDGMFPRFLRHRIIHHVNNASTATEGGGGIVLSGADRKASQRDSTPSGSAAEGREGSNSNVAAVAGGGNNTAIVNSSSGHPISKEKLKGFLRSRASINMPLSGLGSNFSQPSEVESHPYDDDRPIADYFPCTTVMFADLAGFTSWSHGRPPEHVFQLLERLFSEFDSMARRQGVFKVETIGDCYTAATGLPDPQADHAERMCAFADDCRRKFRQIRGEMEFELGGSVRDLELRIGCHSGGVTAGVLRGQRARFQLFGKTVYEASRMESSGQKNRIQISEYTACLLVDAGREEWLTKRRGKVSGRQTFWVCDEGGEDEGGGDDDVEQQKQGEEESSAPFPQSHAAVPVVEVGAIDKGEQEGVEEQQRLGSVVVDVHDGGGGDDSADDDEPAVAADAAAASASPREISDSSPRRRGRDEEEESPSAHCAGIPDGDGPAQLRQGGENVANDGAAAEVECGVDNDGNGDENTSPTDEHKHHNGVECSRNEALASSCQERDDLCMQSPVISVCSDEPETRRRKEEETWNINYVEDVADIETGAGNEHITGTAAINESQQPGSKAATRHPPLLGEGGQGEEESGAPPSHHVAVVIVQETGHPSRQPHRKGGGVGDDNDVVADNFKGTDAKDESCHDHVDALGKSDKCDDRVAPSASSPPVRESHREDTAMHPVGSTGCVVKIISHEHQQENDVNAANNGNVADDAINFEFNIDEQHSNGECSRESSDDCIDEPVTGFSLCSGTSNDVDAAVATPTHTDNEYNDIHGGTGTTSGPCGGGCVNTHISATDVS